MSKLYAYSVFDAATKSFERPMFLFSEGHATRVWTDEVNRRAEDNQLYRHPDDFSLYFVGTFDTEFGRLTPEDPRMFLSGKQVFVKGE